MLGANAMIDTSASQRAQRGTKRPSGKTYMNSKIAPTPTRATTADGTSHARGRSNRWYGKVMPAQYIRSTSDTKNAIRSSGRRQKMIAPTAIGTSVKAASSETREAAKKSTERPRSLSSRTFSEVRRINQLHDTVSVQGLRSRANSLGMLRTKTPTVRSATATHTTRAMRSQRPWRVVADVEARGLIPRLLDPVPLPRLSQHHSTAPPSPKRYGNRYEVE